MRVPFPPCPYTESPPLRVYVVHVEIFTNRFLPGKASEHALDGRQHQSRDGPRRAQWPYIRRDQSCGSLLLRLKIRLLQPERRLLEPIHATVNERNY